MKISENRNKSEKKAVKTIALMMGATVIAKLLGMFRSVLQAGIFGTTPEANAFTAASKLPLTFFDLLLSAAILGCFIPVYNSFKDSKDEAFDSKKADNFAAVFLTFIILACGILALVGIIFAEPMIRLIAPNLGEGDINLAVTLARIMFPLVLFTGSTYTLIGVLQSKGSFIAPAMISAISNAGVVAYLLAVMYIDGEWKIYGLAVVYMLSWLLQLITLMFPLKRLGFRLRFVFDLKSPELLKALKMVPPIMVGSWLAPLGILLGQFFAARVGVEGATTDFDIANNVYVIIAGTLTYSICNYTFPKISRLMAGGDTEKFANTVRQGLMSALFIVIPFMAAALVLADEGVAILYLRGKFTPVDAMNTTSALRPIIMAMPFFCLTELLSRVFYARGEVKIPMTAAAFGILANLVSGLVLIKLKFFGISAVGIANALGQITAATVLLIFALKRIKNLMNAEFAFGILKLFVGGILVFAISALLKMLLQSNPYESSMIINTAKLFVAFLPSAVVYLVFTKLVKIGFGGISD